MIALLLALATPPTPTPIPTPRNPPAARELAQSDSPQPRGLADLARERKLKAKTFDVPPSAQGATASDQERRTATGGGSASAPLDADEGKWRARAVRAQQDLERAQRNLASAEIRYPKPQTHGSPTPEEQRELAHREQLLEIWRADVREAKAAQEMLAESCRKTSGCLPGWLR